MIPEGSDAISPAPHHDIYSIEDLRQLVFSLKEATEYKKPVIVKSQPFTILLPLQVVLPAAELISSPLMASVAVQEPLLPESGIMLVFPSS